MCASPFLSLPDFASKKILLLYVQTAGCPVIKGEKWLATKWLRAYEWIDAPLSQLEAVKEQRELMRLAGVQART